MGRYTYSHVAAAVLVTMAGASLVSAHRLPHVAVPNHYELTFTPDFNKHSVFGVETINVRVLTKTTRITLNALDITFISASITSRGTVQHARVELDPRSQTATLAVDKAIAPGPAKIHIKFAGKLGKQPHGFYQSEANSRTYVTTQLEPNYARTVFPCFDEPAYKATFSIALVAPNDDTAISNGSLVSVTPGPGPARHTLEFSPSPKMSSYLVAMTVGDYKCLKASTDGVPIRVCAPAEEVGEGEYALKAAEHYLHYYDRYFAVKYPFGKLDLVATPGFPRGSAMENTAAIFFGKAALLVNGQSGAGPGLGAPAQIIAHEMAHQWFGDLVTMKWWNDVWLNEGFATWMSFKAVADWRPTWHVGLNVASYASSNGQSNAAPIRQHADTPSEIASLGGNVLAAYLAPAAVLRMVEIYEGPRTFRTGVNKYLRKYAYSNATGPDFWNIQAAVSKLPINRIMASFITQPGVPLVSLKASCQKGTERVALSQRRYFSDRAAFERGSKQIWEIPVGLKWPEPRGGLESRVVLLKSKQQSFRLPGCTPWVFGNNGANGYYVVGYGSTNLGALAEVAESDLTPAERVSLALDESALIPIGEESITDFMTLAQALRFDSSAEVIGPLLRVLDRLGQRLVTGADSASYETWIRNWLRPQVGRLGWQAKPGEGARGRDFRATVLWASGFSGRDPGTLAKARKLAELYLADPSSVDPSLVPTILNLAALNGGRPLYEEFLTRARSVKGDHSYLYWSALAHFTRPSLVRRTLEIATSAEAPRKYIFDALPAMMQDPASRRSALELVTTHWGAIENIPFAAPFVIRQMGYFCDAAHEARVRQFFTAHLAGSSAQGAALNLALNRIDACLAQRSQQGPELASWLAGRDSFAKR